PAVNVSRVHGAGSWLTTAGPYPRATSHAPRFTSLAAGSRLITGVLCAPSRAPGRPGPRPPRGRGPRVAAPSRPPRRRWPPAPRRPAVRPHRAAPPAPRRGEVPPRRRQHRRLAHLAAELAAQPVPVRQLRQPQARDEAAALRQAEVEQVARLPCHRPLGVPRA